MSKEITIQSVSELEKDKVYHIVIDKGVITKDLVDSFVKKLREGGIKAFVSHGEVKVEELSEMFEALDDDKKAILRAALRPVTFFDPTQHEQTK